MGDITSPSCEPRVLIATDGAERYRGRAHAVVVHTPLDLIRTLDSKESIAVAILSDAFARETEVASFLRETYPDLRLLIA